MVTEKPSDPMIHERAELTAFVRIATLHVHFLPLVRIPVSCTSSAAKNGFQDEPHRIRVVITDATKETRLKRSVCHFYEQLTQ